MFVCAQGISETTVHKFSQINHGFLRIVLYVLHVYEYYLYIRFIVHFSWKKVACVLQFNNL